MTLPEDWSVPDWSREKPRQFWDPSRKLIQSIRDYQSCNFESAWSKLLSKFCVLRHRFWSVVTSSDIPINSNLGGGFSIPHPVGVVIHPTAKVGANCMMLQNTTLTESVELGYHVDLGAGAIVTHGAKIGNNTTIGANAVVLKDLPANCTAVGVPVRIVNRKEDS